MLILPEPFRSYMTVEYELMDNERLALNTTQRQALLGFIKETKKGFYQSVNKGDRYTKNRFLEFITTTQKNLNDLFESHKINHTVIIIGRMFKTGKNQSPHGITWSSKGWLTFRVGKIYTRWCLIWCGLKYQWYKRYI